MKTPQQRSVRSALLVAAIACLPLAATASPGHASTRQASPGSRITIVRGVSLPGAARFIGGFAEPDAARQLIYLRQNEHVVEVDTDTGVRHPFRNVLALNGMLLNRVTGDLYTFNEEDPKTAGEGFDIIHGTQVVRHLDISVVAGINLGHGDVDLVREPENPDNQSYLLRYHGTALIAKTPICDGLRAAPNGGNDSLGYNPRTGLLYVSCGEWLPKNRYPRVQIFRGTTLVKTLTPHVDGLFVRVDPVRDITYVVGWTRIEVIDGTKVARITPIPPSGAFSAGAAESPLTTSNGMFYIGTAGSHGAVHVFRGTQLLGTVNVPDHDTVVDQSTGVVYVEHKQGSSRVIDLLRGPHVIGSLTTDAIITGWDPVTGDVLATSPKGLVAIHGDHVVQTVKVGANPHDIVGDAAGHRLYTIAGTTLTILHTTG
jgi:hypothetical protein